jgi:hypothetical protein
VNFCVGSSNSVSVTITPPPGIWVYGNLQLCNGETTYLCASDYYGPYLWSTGETTQCIQVNTAGSYSVTIGNCTSDPVNITVASDYRPSITVTGDYPTCYPNTVTLAANENSSYLWNTGETTQSITVDYWTSYIYGGYFSVVNPDENYCVDASNSVSNIKVNLVYVYTYQSTDICRGSMVDIYSGSYWYGSSYLWSNGSTDWMITVGTAGTYTVSIDGCASYNDVTVTVTNAPANDDICNAQSLTMGVPTTFSNQCATTQAGEPVPPLATDWVNGQNGWGADNGYWTAPSIEHTVWFSFVATNSGAVNILVDGFDSQVALYKSSNYACNGILTQVAANEDGSPSWTYGSLVKGYCLTKGKRYFIQVDGWYGTQGTGTIKVTPVTNQLTICHNYDHHWVNLLIDGCAMAAHLAHGDYIGACTASRPTVATEEDITSLSLAVYPNPFNEMMTVSFTSDKAEAYTVSVVDLTGRVILSENKMAAEGANEEALNLQNISSGMYLLVINKGNNVLQTRIVKE